MVLNIELNIKRDRTALENSGTPQPRCRLAEELLWSDGKKR